jgi:hypothetical protein
MADKAVYKKLQKQYNTTMKNKISINKVNSFMTNVNKLGGNSYVLKDEDLGTVRLIKRATSTSSRKFSVSGSKAIRNGAYSLGGMRAAYRAVAK